MVAQALEYHIRIIEPKIIDELNIYRATQRAMQDISDMFAHADGVLTDAMPLPHNERDVISLVKGDQRKRQYCSRKHFGQGYTGLYDGSV